MSESERVIIIYNYIFNSLNFNSLECIMKISTVCVVPGITLKGYVCVNNIYCMNNKYSYTLQLYFQLDNKRAIFNKKTHQMESLINNYRR